MLRFLGANIAVEDHLILPYFINNHLLDVIHAQIRLSLTFRPLLSFFLGLDDPNEHLLSFSSDPAVLWTADTTKQFLLYLSLFLAFLELGFSNSLAITSLQLFCCSLNGAFGTPTTEKLSRKYSWNFLVDYSGYGSKSTKFSRASKGFCMFKGRFKAAFRCCFLSLFIRLF